MAIIGSVMYRFEGDSSSLVRAAEQAEKSVSRLEQQQNKMADSSKNVEKQFTAMKVAAGVFTTVLTGVGARLTVLTLQTGSFSKGIGLLAADFSRLFNSVKNLPDILRRLDFSTIASDIGKGISSGFEKIKNAPEVAKLGASIASTIGEGVKRNSTAIASGVSSAVSSSINASGRVTQQMMDAVAKQYQSFKKTAGQAAEAIHAIETAGLSTMPILGRYARTISTVGVSAQAASVGLMAMGGAGTAAQIGLAAVSTGSLALVSAFGLLVTAAGNVVKRIGEDLVAASTNYLHVANELQRETFGLNVAVEGYIRATGDASESTHSLMQIINELAQTTTLTRTELSRGVLVMLDMAQVTGLTAGQIGELTEAAADFAAVTGNEFQNVVYGIDQALRGFPRVAASMGLALTEAEVQSTAFAKSLNKTVEEMTMAEKSTAFTQLILEKMAFTAGKSAVAALETFQGSLVATQARLLTIHQEIGTGVQQAWFPFQRAIFNIVDALSKGDKELFQFIGRLTATFGPILQVSGLVLQWAATLGTIVVVLPLILRLLPGVGSVASTAFKAAAAASTSFSAATAASAVASAALSTTIRAQLIGTLAVLRTVLLSFFTIPVITTLAAIAAAVTAVGLAYVFLTRKVDDSFDTLTGLIDKYVHLRNDTHLTEQQQKELAKTTDELKTKFPELAKALDEYNDKVKESAAEQIKFRVELLKTRKAQLESELEGLRSQEKQIKPRIIFSPFGGPLLTEDAFKKEEADTKIKQIAEVIKKISDEIDKLTKAQKKNKDEDFVNPKIGEIKRFNQELTLGLRTVGSYINELDKIKKKTEEAYGSDFRKYPGIVKDFYVDLVSQINQAKNASDDLVHSLRNQVRALKGEFATEGGQALARLEEARRKLIEMTRPGASINQKAINEQKNLITQLEKEYDRILSNLTSSIRMTSDAFGDLNAEIREFSIQTKSELKEGASEARRSLEGMLSGSFMSRFVNDPEGFAKIFRSLNSVIAEASKTMSDLEMPEMFVELGQAVQSFGDMPVTGFELILKHLKELKDQGLSGIVALREAIRRAMLDIRALENLENIPAGYRDESVLDYSTDGQPNPKTLAKMRVSEQESKDLLNPEVYKQRLEEIKTTIEAMRELKVPEDKIFDQERLLRRSLADQSVAARRENLTELRKFDENSVKIHLENVKQLYEDAGMAPVEVERRVQRERAAIRAQVLEDDREFWDLQVHNAETYGDAFKAALGAEAREWQRSWENKGEVARNAISEIKGDFKGLLTDAMTGELQTFEDYFKSVTDRIHAKFADMMVEMVFEWVAALANMKSAEQSSNLGGSLGRTGYGTSGGTVEGLGKTIRAIGGWFSGSGGGGGDITPVDTIDSRDTLGYQKGGIVPGSFSQAFPAVLHGGEVILNPMQQKAFASAVMGKEVSENEAKTLFKGIVGNNAIEKDMSGAMPVGSFAGGSEGFNITKVPTKSASAAATEVPWWGKAIQVGGKALQGIIGLVDVLRGAARMAVAAVPGGIGSFTYEPTPTTGQRITQGMIGAAQIAKGIGSLATKGAVGAGFALGSEAMEGGASLIGARPMPIWMNPLGTDPNSLANRIINKILGGEQHQIFTQGMVDPSFSPFFGSGKQSETYDPNYAVQQQYQNNLRDMREQIAAEMEFGGKALPKSAPVLPVTIPGTSPLDVTSIDGIGKVTGGKVSFPGNIGGMGPGTSLVPLNSTSFPEMGINVTGGTASFAAPFGGATEPISNISTQFLKPSSNIVNIPLGPNLFPPTPSYEEMMAFKDQGSWTGIQATFKETPNVQPAFNPPGFSSGWAVTTIPGFSSYIQQFSSNPQISSAATWQTAYSAGTPTTAFNNPSYISNLSNIVNSGSSTGGVSGRGFAEGGISKPGLATLHGEEVVLTPEEQDKVVASLNLPDDVFKKIVQSSGAGLTYVPGTPNSSGYLPTSSLPIVSPAETGAGLPTSSTATTPASNMPPAIQQVQDVVNKFGYYPWMTAQVPQSITLPSQSMAEMSPAMSTAMTTTPIEASSTAPFSPIVTNLLAQGSGAVSQYWSQPSTPPLQFATGGVVPGPVGKPVPAIVHGGEEVLTPDQRMMERQMTVNVVLRPELIQAMKTTKGEVIMHVNRDILRGGITRRTFRHSG